MSFCHRSLHWQGKTLTTIISVIVLFHFLRSSPAWPLHTWPIISVPIDSAICSKIISAVERTFPIMSSISLSFLLFYLSALRAIKHPMNCDAAPWRKKRLPFPFSIKHQRSGWGGTALQSNMSLMEPKHTWLLTNLQLLL